NVCKAFPGVVALDDVSVRLGRGTVHALSGENGAGKSTLMKIVAGVYAADAGELLLNGRDLRLRSPRDALDFGIAMIHQELNLMPCMSVAENIWIRREPISALGLISHLELKRRTRALLERLRIDIDPQPLEQGAGPALQLEMADESQSADGLAPDPDVLRDAHARHQVQLLMDHGDAKVKRIARRAEAQIAAVEEQLAGIRSVDTCDDLHERRLAGAVLAAQGVHRAAPESHRHIVQGHDSGKRLADI